MPRQRANSNFIRRHERGAEISEMNWLKRLFSQHQKAVPPPTQVPTISIASDIAYNANEDLLEGVEFIATLHVTTPYSVLIHHGEAFDGPPSKAPQYGTQGDGIWIPKIKSWNSLGIDLPELPPSQHATDIGSQHPQAYLPFLLAFRRIFESDKTDELKIKELRALVSEKAEFLEFWERQVCMREDFPRNLFYRSFLELPGVGRKTAQALYNAGFRSIDKIRHSEPSELQRVPGIGPALVKKLTSEVR